jgi:hypothetical protein
LSDQALLYRTDDLVHYRGDVLPQRLWKITNVGDRVLTIEATSDEGLEPGDRTKIVTSIDIYKPDDFAYTSPFAESLPGQIGQYNTLDQTNYPVNPQLQPMMGGDAFGQIPAPFTGQVPAINIKVVGGNDFSRGGQTDNTEDVIQTETSNGETEVGKGGGNTKSSDNGKIDFSTLKIVKQQ